jgi:hypothetical protein
VLHWKIKPVIVVAVVSVLAMSGGFLDFKDLLCGFYW